MSKTTKPRNDWDAIKKDITESKLTLREIAEKYNTDHSYIHKKAKKEGWLNAKQLVEKYDELGAVVAELVEDNINKEQYKKAKELQKEIHASILPSQIEQVNKDIALSALYKSELLIIQQKFAEVTKKSLTQVSKILDNCADGLYTSISKADGTSTYERTTRFMSDLAPFFVENNKALGLTTAQVAIQNNLNANNPNGADDDSVVKFYIPANGRENTK